MVSGKAQRLTHLINQLLPEMKVMVHPKISRYHQKSMKSRDSV